MANTANFGWETPDDTDLVKDGAAAMRTLGNAIDTSMVDLKGGTTGQILSKTSNTDMDFTWIANDVGDITAVTVSSPLTGGGSSGSVNVAIQDGTTTQKGAVQLENSTSSTSTTTAAVPTSVKSAYDLANAAIPKSLIDAEGDLIVGDSADAVQRLAIGTNGQVLTVDTAVDGKIKWATAGGSTFAGVSVYRTSDLSINNATGTAITFDAEFYDTDGFHSTTTNTSRFTVPSGKAGKYLISGVVQFEANTTGMRMAYFLKNGSLFNYGSSSNPGSATTRGAVACSFVADLAVSDYIEVYALQSSGGALNVLGSDTYSTSIQFTYLGA